MQPINPSAFSLCLLFLKGGVLKSREYVKNIALYGMLVALAMIFSYIEAMIPFHFGIQGVKLGLANLVIIICLYLLGIKAAFSVSMIRIVLIAFTFANLSTMMFSLAGGGFSLLCMIGAKKSRRLSMTAVSIIGGITHNIAQLVLAVFIVDTAGVLSYLPVLLIAGTISGFFIGMLAAAAIEKLSGAALGRENS